jgi:hypothetical protein
MSANVNLAMIYAMTFNDKVDLAFAIKLVDIKKAEI